MAPGPEVAGARVTGSSRRASDSVSDSLPLLRAANGQQVRLAQAQVGLFCERARFDFFSSPVQTPRLHCEARALKVTSRARITSTAADASALAADLKRGCTSRVLRARKLLQVSRLLEATHQSASNIGNTDVTPTKSPLGPSTSRATRRPILLLIPLPLTSSSRLLSDSPRTNNSQRVFGSSSAREIYGASWAVALLFLQANAYKEL